MADEKWSTWDNHKVWTYDMLQVGPSAPFDKFLGSTLILCTLIGLPGNIISFIYFTKTATANISLKLYSVISFTDSITSLLIIAFAKVLFEGRDPGWFTNIHFCKFWAIAYEMVCQYSLFLVTMISVTRAITIVKPQYRINVTAVKVALILHPVEYLLERVVGTHVGVQDTYGYSIDDPTCWVSSTKRNAHIAHQMLIAFKVGVASVATFIAFAVSVRKLRGHRNVGSTEKIHRASVTITIFTLVFLLCNILYFFNMLVYGISMYVHYPEYPPGIYSS